MTKVSKLDDRDLNLETLAIIRSVLMGQTSLDDHPDLSGMQQALLFAAIIACYEDIYTNNGVLENLLRTVQEVLSVAHPYADS